MCPIIPPALVRLAHPQVTPVYSSDSLETSLDGEQQELVEAVTSLLPKLHSLLLGPGMGRDPRVLKAAAAIVRAARLRGLPVVLDADSLSMVIESPDTVRGYRLAVLTPNANEFRLLCERMNEQESSARGGKGSTGGAAAAVGSGEKRDSALESKTEAVERLARNLGGVTVVLKGKVDIISDGARTVACGVPGGLKRCGGIGDVLSGAMATAQAWVSLQVFEEDEVQKSKRRGRMWGVGGGGGSGAVQLCLAGIHQINM